jgi:DNA-binding transcriptional regulator YhcF (GntR family)
MALATVIGGAIGGVGTARKRRSGTPHRTGARVLRDSVEAGTFEHAFFVSPAKGETDRLLRAARRILDAGRQLRREARAGLRTLTPAEQLLTTLTAASVRVFEEILTLARLNKGRVFPSYDHLADATGLGRATVARALKILEGIGFLVRQRRFKRIEDATGPGPRFEQTSNAYRTFLPAIVARYLPRWMRLAPIPDDMLQREADHALDMDHMVRSLTCRELAEAHVGGALGKVLARLGAAIDRQESESHNDMQPLPNFYSKKTGRQMELA